MVDFGKQLAQKNTEVILDPIKLYETLDRASDKGPLRPAQEAVLAEWHSDRRGSRDLILKLHTGQGKTLIGLLILQSKLNEGHGPAVYLCPNNFLVNQTCTQAKQFGISFCTADGDLPHQFVAGTSLLITSVQKLFNGQTRFRLGAKSIQLGSLLMDDCHACIDAIRDAFVISLPKKEPLYAQLVELFSASLEAQRAGTFADIRNSSRDAILPVPYWAWQDRQNEVVAMLSKHHDRDAVKFAWPLIRDMVRDCLCLVSGDKLEISPYLPPIEVFGSYHRATHRIFMSATVADDSFLVKGLRLSPETVRNPLIYKKERWSGEKMVLIPSLIDESLDRDVIVKEFAKGKTGRTHGVVALTPSFKVAEQWKHEGAVVATKETLEAEVAKLRNGDCENAVAVASRYDGVDLPDETCRILVFDSKPHVESLHDRYEEVCRPGSIVTSLRTVRTVEQGLGRSVRGEKDYCVVILIGPELVKFLRIPASKKHLSEQTQKQIETAMKVVSLALADIEAGSQPMRVLQGLIGKCLDRDNDWKRFYAQEMDSVGAATITGQAMDIYQRELEAELAFQQNDPLRATACLQKLIDELIKEQAEKAWYIQEMARYTHSHSKTDGNKLQVHAHRQNAFLLKPSAGMQVNKITIVSQKRIRNIINWVQRFNNFEELRLELDEMLETLQFGVDADRFEAAFETLGTALGFISQRPDHVWGEGPDNLWALREGEYLLVECKNEILETRNHLYKEETGQMNNACGWFAREYAGAKATKIIIAPVNATAGGAEFVDADVRVMRKAELGKLTKCIRYFFSEFRTLDARDLSEAKVQELLNNHHLDIDALVADFALAPRKA